MDVLVAIVDAVVASVWPMIGDGKVRPVIGARYPIQEAAEAHRALSSGETSQVPSVPSGPTNSMCAAGALRSSCL